MKFNLNLGVKNIGWLLLDKFTKMAVGIVVYIFLARGLGPEQFGILSYSTACLFTAAALAGFGLSEIIVRDLIINSDQVNRVLGSAIYIIFSTSILSFGLFWLFILQFEDLNSATGKFLAVISFAVLFKFSDISIYWFEAVVKSKFVTIVQAPTSILFAALKLFLLIFDTNLQVFAILILTEIAFTSLLLLVVLNFRGVELRKLTLIPTFVKNLVSSGWPLIFTAVFVSLYMKTDEIMLGLLGDKALVGVYAAAARISALWYFIPIIVVASFYPILLRNRENIDYLHGVQVLLDLVVLISFCIALAMTIFADQLIFMMYGEEYKEAGSVLTLHTWSLYFVSVGIVSSRWMIVENLQKLSMYKAFLGFISNILLNYFLITRYGPHGAAVATLISFGISAFVTDLLFRETRAVFFMKLRSINLFGAFNRVFLFRKNTVALIS